jgi:hypothetical protein
MMLPTNLTDFLEEPLAIYVAKSQLALTEEENLRVQVPPPSRKYF